MDDFAGQLKERGLRATKGRIELLKLLKRAGKPLSVGEILERPTVRLDQVTLYRALETLADAGFVRKGIGFDRAMHFEYAGKSHHHHLVCMDCGFSRQCVVC